MDRIIPALDVAALRDHARRLLGHASALREAGERMTWSGAQAELARHALRDEADHCQAASADLLRVAAAAERHAQGLHGPPTTRPVSSGSSSTW